MIHTRGGVSPFLPSPWRQGQVEKGMLLPSDREKSGPGSSPAKESGMIDPSPATHQPTAGAAEPRGSLDAVVASKVAHADGEAGLDTEFKRGLGLFDATMVVAGSMIGSGIFIVSADMSRQLGSPGWLLMAWLITGILTVAGALSYGELAGMMPRAGGQYVFL